MIKQAVLIGTVALVVLSLLLLPNHMPPASTPPIFPLTQPEGEKMTQAATQPAVRQPITTTSAGTTDSGGTQVTLVGAIHWATMNMKRPMMIPSIRYPYITVDGRNYRLIVTGLDYRLLGGTGLQEGEQVKVTGWLQTPSAWINLPGGPAFTGDIAVTNIQPA